MKQDTKTQIKNFLSNLNTEIDVLNLVDIENIDYSDAYNSIYEMIDENQGFAIEIIYYYNAINYLKDKPGKTQICLKLNIYILSVFLLSKVFRIQT